MIKPFHANLVNAIVLIIMGGWAYFDAAADSRSLTALIPVAFGLVLISMSAPLKKEDKVFAHIVVVLTLVIIIALFMPLKGAIGRDDPLAIFRVGAMMTTSFFAMGAFIKSFIDARRNK